MRLKILQIMVAGCVAFGIALSAQAASVDQIIAFGDSLSDNGNLFRYTTIVHSNDASKRIAPGTAYWKGRFSNGPVWAEELFKLMKKGNPKLTLNDYAVGGATIQAERTVGVWPFHTIHDEIFNYLNTQAEKTNSRNRHLYAIWMGANDYLNLIDQDIPIPYDPETETTAAVNLVQNDIKDLIQDVNASQFIILNLPDLGKTPGATMLGDDKATALSQLSSLHNMKIQQMIDQLSGQYPNVTFVYVDIFAAMNSLLTTHSWRGETVSEVDSPCYFGMISSPAFKVNMKFLRHSKFTARMNTNRAAAGDSSVCSNPRDYLFWDWIHPTTRIHRMIADQAIAELAAKGIN